MKDTFKIITEEDRLLYSYIRGSHCHGIATETSDIDRGGIFIAPKNNLIDLGFNYQDQVADEKNDMVWWEFKKFMNLLIKSNPTVLEALFIDDKFVEFEHPAITEIKKHRDMFLTKKCFPSFFNYAKSQVEKARGLNKKIVNPVTERLTPFDFAYTFYNQGSTKIGNWLANRGLDKDFCGLVHIPNMHDTYGVYYDWGAHIHENIIKYEDFEIAAFGANVFGLLFFGWFGYGQVDEETRRFAKFVREFYGINDKKALREWYDKNQEVKHYRGMCLENSTDMRGSSVSKGEKPLCWMVYNESGFKDHCKKYKEYKDWEKNRNPIRYESNLNKNYDAKNMCECFRLMHCGIEIASGKGYIVNRSGIDAEFLLDIKNHKFEYEYLIAELEKLKVQMSEIMEKSNIPDDIDPNFVNELYLKVINDFFN